MSHNVSLTRRVIQIADLDSTNYRLKVPFDVYLETFKENVVAYSIEFDQYGIGKSDVDALNDFKSTLVNQYEVLQEERDNLGPYTKRQLEALPRILVLTTIRPPSPI